MEALSLSDQTVRFLVVDDDEVFRLRLERALRSRGYEVRGAGDVSEARAVSGEFVADAAVVDLKMPGEIGLALIAELKTKNPDIRVLVLTGYGSIATALEAVRLGAKHYLTKPADTEQILSALGFVEGAAPAELAPEVPSLSQVEWEHINRVLHDCDGNITKAAKLLGVHRRSLQRKLAKLP